jgi:hypothetical protein
MTRPVFIEGHFLLCSVLPAAAGQVVLAILPYPSGKGNMHRNKKCPRRFGGGGFSDKKQRDKLSLVPFVVFGNQKPKF